MQPSFSDKVYTITKRIPKGKVVTYGQLARLAGSPGAARAVGMCMKHNPDMKTIPCHRVVSSTGQLTGYSAGEGVSTKKQMLIKEGVLFNNDRVDLASSQWQHSS